MSSTKQLILGQLKEVRRQSLRVWEALPEEKFHWKPDPEAMTMLEVVRHVLKADAWFQFIVEKRGDIKDYSVWDDERPLISVQDELDFHKPIRADFLKFVEQFSEADFSTIEIQRKDKGAREWPRKLGPYLLRVCYHETVHTGQFLAYLRMMEVDRPWIWND